MATGIYLANNVGVKVASVDLSAYVTSVTLNRQFDELEVTAMGDTGHKFVKGLESSSVTIEFLNDMAAGKVMSTLQTAWGSTTSVVLLQDKSLGDVFQEALAQHREAAPDRDGVSQRTYSLKSPRYRRSVWRSRSHDRIACVQKGRCSQDHQSGHHQGFRLFTQGSSLLITC